jgi:hypothetical protein
MANRPGESVLRIVMEETGLMQQWELFEKNELNTFLERQVAISSAGDTKGMVSLRNGSRYLPPLTQCRKRALSLIQSCNLRWLLKLSRSMTTPRIGHQPIRSETCLRTL